MQYQVISIIQTPGSNSEKKIIILLICEYSGAIVGSALTSLLVSFIKIEGKNEQEK